jgi:hypothetical protein
MSKPIELAVGDANGCVQLVLSEVTDRVALEPANATVIAEAIARAAYNAAYGTKRTLTGHGPSIISNQVRNRMVARIALMLKGMTEGNRSHRFQAEQIVDTILAEVT